MSETLETLRQTIAAWPPQTTLLAYAVAAVVAALVLHRAVMALLGRVARSAEWTPDDAFDRYCYRPLQLTLPLLFLRALGGGFSERVPEAIAAGLTVALILSIGWLLASLTLVLEKAIVARLSLDAADNLRARRVYTQVRYLRRIAMIAIVIVTGSAILMSFDPLRRIGAGLLTSAGIAGVVIGFAAQRTVGNLIAGFQIAFTQPIRTDDVVVVEGEWGRIEEITLTYVVVRIWDERRLVVPIGYFIERPFQNWTRVSAALLGSVHLQVDYRVPVDELRTELQRIVERSSNWDGRLWRVHVTEARDHTLEVRALVSARDSGSAWELRCEVREGLVRYLAEHHPDALPRMRAELASLEADASPPTAGKG